MRKSRRRAARVAGSVAGGAAGLLAGAAVTLGIVVARARLGGEYLESTGDLLGLSGLPVPVGLVVGVLAGAAGGPVLALAGAAVLGGAMAGAGVGAAIAWAASLEPEDVWAAGVVAASMGVLLGGVLAAWAARRRPRPRSERVAVPVAAAFVLGLLGLAMVVGVPTPAGPAGPGQEGWVAAVAEDESRADAVVYLVGDPGDARYHSHPILPRLAADVATWSGRVASPGAVAVVVLGDVVYPAGMHDPGTAEFARDSARVADQIRVVTGGSGSATGASMRFLAGNHDWGPPGARRNAGRLRNLERFLERARRGGADVSLAPAAGTGGPVVLDVGRHLRLVFLDTAWWILDAEPGEREAVVEGVTRALAGAGTRAVVIAGHHPFQTGGRHGGLIPFWRNAGISLLLNRSGALLQDLGSRPYAELRSALGAAFRRHGRPLVFAGGHDHSLQVIRHEGATTPRYTVVSGAASRLSGVEGIRGTMLQASTPGYVRLVARSSGAVDLFVEAAPERFLVCRGESRGEMERCLSAGVAGYRTLFSTRLRAAGEVR